MYVVIEQEFWAREHLSEGFYLDTLPMFARDEMLSIMGKIWLPHLPSVRDGLKKAQLIIDTYYDVFLVGIDLIHYNPLYLATDRIHEDLLGMPLERTNQTQLAPYLAFSEHPFVVLQVKPAFAALSF